MIYVDEIEIGNGNGMVCGSFRWEMGEGGGCMAAVVGERVVLNVLIVLVMIVVMVL
jgi:hypothetical protein